jgi:hypothetical protein
MVVLLIFYSWSEGLKTGFGRLADLLSFASPKESKQRKGEPKAAPLRGALRYSHRPGLGANSLRSPCTRLCGLQSLPRQAPIY